MADAEATRLCQLVDAFQGKTVLVLGDLVADEYVYGKPARISREAPVLILRYLSRESRLGGAANACHNLHALGARVLPLGVVGADRAGESVRRLFVERGIVTEGVVTAAERPTPVKTRVMAGGYRATPRQQVVRVDREPEGSLPPSAEEAIAERLQTWAGRADAVVLSDYGYGTITARLLDEARALLARRVVVVADSRHDLLRFQGVTAATPSESEVEEVLDQTLDGDKAVEQAGWRLLDRLGSRLLLVTRGSRGMALFEREADATFLPIHGSDEVADVTGAGDTVISAFTLALAGGASPVDAARLANYAGGLVVMKRGTAAVSRAELTRTIRDDAASREGHDGKGARP